MRGNNVYFPVKRENNGKTTGKLFSFEQLLRAKDTVDFKLQHKPVDTTHPVDV